MQRYQPYHHHHPHHHHHHHHHHLYHLRHLHHHHLKMKIPAASLHLMESLLAKVKDVISASYKGID